jgi:enamine deaminase RidA (YjgF/YER057c/UK114 family)
MTMSTLRMAAIVSLALGAQVPAMQSSKQIVNLGATPNAPFSQAVTSGPFIYVAGTLAIDDGGGNAGGDAGTQTRRVLDRIAAVLKAAGSSIDRAAAVHVYLKRASDFQAMNAVYRTYWPKDPPVRTTIEADLVVPDALVEISMVALAPGVERQVVHPAGWVPSANPYSYGIKSGDTLFLAGLVSRDGRDNSPVGGDMGAQTKTVMENARAILGEAGMSLSDVVSSRVYITDGRLFGDMNAIYRTYFASAPPARATVISPLMGPQYLVEITMVAVRHADRQAITTPNADGSPGRVNPNLSSAIRVGSRLYLSGMLGDTDANRGDVRAQTRATLASVERTLTAAGFGWSDVVDGVVYLTDVREFAAMNAGYREIFSRDFPARATVRAGLVAPNGLVEIMFVAAR